MPSTPKLFHALQLADNALIIGHRLSEWCGHGPILEQDIALANTALDHLGTARSLYQYATDLYNALPPEVKDGIFSSPALDAARRNGEAATEDSLAYLRDGWDFRNVLLAEQPNGDWAYTIARQFYYDTFNFLYMDALQQSASAELAAIAEKAVKEAAYHQRWSAEWVIRLGDGTEESRAKMIQALKDYWPYTGELIKAVSHESVLEQSGIAPSLPLISAAYDARVNAVLEEAGLQRPADDVWMHTGGKEGKHTEHLGYILAEMQFMQRTYPGMEW